MSKEVPSKSDLPEGWTLAQLRDVTQHVPNVKPETEPDRMFGYVDISSICNATNRIVDRKTFSGREAPSRARRPIQSDDVLFSNVRTYLRNVATVEPDLGINVCSTGFTVLRSNGAVEPRFLFRYVLSDEFIEGVTSMQRGAHYPATTDRVVRGETIPLPPLAEQRRIAARVDSLLGRVQEVQQSLTCVATLLNRFRQSIFGIACGGRLTEDWRNATGIHVGRAWRMGVPLSEICSAISDGDHLPPPKQPTGIPFLTIGNISSGHLDFSETRFVPESYFLRIKPERKPELGDVLFTVVGASIGIPVLVNTDRPFCFQRHIAILRPSSEVISEYLVLLLGTPAVFKEAWARVTGTAQPTLPLGNLRTIPVSLPPLAEQHEIVRRVDALFKLADEIERRMTAARSRADKLSQAILTRAFRGELVSTEADLARAGGRDYETGDQLLARIRQATAPSKETRGQRAKEKKGKPAMERRKLNRKTVEEAIRAMPKDRFCFDELRAELTGDYEPLREILFSLLDDGESDFTQVFDEKAKAMLFVRRSK